MSYFGRFRNVFARYALRHLDISVRGIDLPTRDGQAGGRADRIVFRDGHLEVSGWSVAQAVTLVSEDGMRAAVRPSGEGRPAFDLRVPAFRLAGQLHLRHADRTEQAVMLPEPDRPARLRAQARLMPEFLWRLACAGPDILRWRIRRDVAARARVKAALGFTDDLPVRPLVAGHLTGDPALPVRGGVTIILPVYNTFDLLPEVLDRVAAHTDLPYRLIVIEDCSTDPDVRPYLRKRAADDARIDLLENAENLGFIGSVNRGFERARQGDDPVVLLNSDAFVPRGWAGRLLQPLWQDATVASVTPMSNDAEIFSSPVLCARTVLRAGEGDRLDDAARAFGAGRMVEAPTGVGFCMAVSPAFLARVPQFDTAFGKGYGEEVDWCQRVRALDGRHVGIANLFVEHRGGESFGSEAKRALVLANNSIITDRYPGYDLEVQRFIRDDPLLTPRLALAVAFVAARAGDMAVPVHLAHSMGGGATMYLNRRVQQEVATVGGAVVVRVGGPMRWRIEVHTAMGRVEGATQDIGLLHRILAPLARRHVIYGCGVGDGDPLELPAVLCALARRHDDGLEILFHDFFPLSPSFCLMGAAGRYLGPPLPGTAAGDDPAHRFRSAEGRTVALADWQRAWKTAMDRATDVTVFSDDSKAQVQAVWPDVPVWVIPHDLLSVPPICAPAGTAIGILGNIGLQKGAQVVSDMARQAPARRFVVVGNVDPSFAMPRSVTVHGTYGHEQLAALVARYGIGAWVIPSVWPETFSFATREALATGLPVFSFDLGAQGEAVGAAPNGRLVPFEGDLAARMLSALPKG